jgi:uncharacterized coiled-coil DUF342 family protein
MKTIIKTLIRCTAIVMSTSLLWWGSASAEVKKVKASGDVKKNVILILDGSGSMWGRINNVPKISIAKEKVLDAVNEVPEHLSVGLMAYGHRREADCNDIELIGVKAGDDRSGLLQFVKNLSPRGKTPLTRSMEISSKYLAEGGSMVLISDGKESCGEDPCEFVKKVKSLGIDFKVHVIGFDVSGEEKAQLECIAEAGDGKYLTADNDKELQTAFNEVQEELSKKFPSDADRVVELNEKVAGLKQEKEALDRQVAELRDEVNKLRAQKNEATQELASCKAELADSLDKNAALTAELAACHEEKEKLRLQLVDLDSQLAKTAEKVQVAEKRASEERQKNDKIYNENQKLKDVIDKGLEENRSLKEQIRLKDRELESLNRKLQSLISSIKRTLSEYE